jgi:hypothetical protein
MSNTALDASNMSPADFAARWPVIASLRLTAEQLELLKRQGYVECRAAGSALGYWRLRFRQNKSLKSVYLGGEAARVNQLKRELLDLQAAHHQFGELQRVVRRSTVCIRQWKQQLSPILQACGCHFHGHAVRRFRNRPQPNSLRRKRDELAV